MNGPEASLLYGFAKTTLVHRHAFIPSPRHTREIGCGARMPASFGTCVSATLEFSDKAVSRAIGRGDWGAAKKLLAGNGRPGARVLLAVLELFGEAPKGAPLFEGMIERYAGRAGAAALAKAAEDFPDFWPAKVWLGLALLRRCEFPKAKRVFDSLVAARPDWPWAYLLRSEWGRVAIEFDAALADLDRAARLEPGDAWVYALRSRVRFQKNPSLGGLEDLDRAIALDP